MTREHDDCSVHRVCSGPPSYFRIVHNVYQGAGGFRGCWHHLSQKNTMTADAHSKSSASLGTAVGVGKDTSSSKKIPPASNLEHGSLEYCACFSRSIIILSFLLYDCREYTSSSFRRHSKSSINTKARPEHQHGLLDFYFSLS